MFFCRNVAHIKKFCIFAAKFCHIISVIGRAVVSTVSSPPQPDRLIFKTTKRRTTKRDGIMTKQDKAFREACKHFFNENWDKPLDKENKKRKSEKFNFEQALVDVGVNEEVARDWMAVRKQKKAANTRTAFNMLIGQLSKIRDKYKITNNDIIMVCVARDWRGCAASWFDNINFADYGIETDVQNTNINQNIPDYGRNRHQEAFVRTFNEADEQNQIF